MFLSDVLYIPSIILYTLTLEGSEFPSRPNFYIESPTCLSLLFLTRFSAIIWISSSVSALLSVAILSSVLVLMLDLDLEESDSKIRGGITDYLLL